ncbi:MAG: hypothetical protein WBP84_08260 [Nitrososphaeraceae archaeon]
MSVTKLGWAIVFQSKRSTEKEIRAVRILGQFFAFNHVLSFSSFPSHLPVHDDS